MRITKLNEKEENTLLEALDSKPGIEEPCL